MKGLSITKIRTPKFLLSLIQPVIIRKANKNIAALYRNLYMESMKRPTHCVIDSEVEANPKFCPTYTLIYKYPDTEVARKATYVWLIAGSLTADPVNLTLQEVLVPYSGPKCTLGSFMVTSEEGKKILYRSCGRDGGKSILLADAHLAYVSVHFVETVAGPKPWYLRYSYTLLSICIHI